MTLPAAKPRPTAVRTVTPSTVARLLGVKVGKVYELIRSGDLPAMNIGARGRKRRFRIFRKDLIIFISRQGIPLDRAQDEVSF